MTMGFRLDGKLPSMNEVIEENRKGPYKGAAMKRAVQDQIVWGIKPYLMKKLLHPVKGAAIIHIFWYEEDMRRDVDNIQSAQKFILDALVETGILKNDSRRYVRQIYHEIHTADQAHVVVQIEAIDDGLR